MTFNQTFARLTGGIQKIRIYYVMTNFSPAQWASKISRHVR